MSLYAADLHGEVYTDTFARLEVNELQRPSVIHTPVILHVPNAVVMELADGGDEAKVTLNLTAQEARNLAMHLVEAARAAEGGLL